MNAPPTSWIMSPDQWQHACEVLRHRSNLHNLEPVDFVRGDPGSVRVINHTVTPPVVRVDAERDPFGVINDMVAGIETAQRPHRLGKRLSEELWDDAKGRIDAYLCTNTDHAREFAVACAAVVATWSDTAGAEGLRLCASAGYALDKTEREKVDRWLLDQEDARDRGYKITEAAHCRICGCTELAACEDGCSWVDDPALKGDLCSQCLDKVDTIHDPEVVTGRTNLEEIRRRDHAAAETMKLQPGDVVTDDGITRADVDDEYERALKAGIDAPVAKLVR